MVPKEFLRSFKKEFPHLPASVFELLELLLEREVDSNYASFNYNPKYDKDDPDERLVKGLLLILSKLPPICDYEKGKLSASIGQLVNLSSYEEGTLSRLRTDTGTIHFRERKAELERLIRDKQWVIDYAEKGEDVTYDKITLRDAKTELKQLKEPEPFNYIGNFFSTLLLLPVSFELPILKRFEHTHVIGTSGSGKTTVLAQLIAQDVQTSAAVIVMAPKGELIPTLSKLKCTDPKRLTIISPEFPISLNVFDLGTTDRSEAAINQTVALLNYVFSSILKADTTGKQDTLLNYCIRLLLLHPDSTLFSLRGLLKQDKLHSDYLPYVERLSPAGQEFFKHEFGSTEKEGYRATKKELLWRLDSVFANNTAIESMLSQTRTDVRMSEVFEKGGVVLIDTSIKEYSTLGSSFLGRFFIGLVSLAAQQRDTSKPLRPVWFYIDECGTYVTEYITELLERGREQRIGLTLSHQNLQQLREVSTQLEHAVHGTAIKIVGKCNMFDGPIMGRQIGAPPDTFEKTPPFMFLLHGFGRGTLAFKTDKDFVENLPQRSKEEMKLLRTHHAPSPRPELKIAAEPTSQYTVDPKTEWSKE